MYLVCGEGNYYYLVVRVVYSWKGEDCMSWNGC